LRPLVGGGSANVILRLCNVSHHAQRTRIAHAMDTLLAVASIQMKLAEAAGLSIRGVREALSAVGELDYADQTARQKIVEEPPS
jgi:hypothetical protein